MQMQMPKPVGLEKSVAKNPRKTGLQSKSIYPPGLAPPTPDAACQLRNSTVAIASLLQDKQFWPMGKLENSSVSTGVPSIASAESDDDSIGRSTPGTPPVYAKKFSVPPPPVPSADFQRNPKKSFGVDAKSASGKRPQQARGTGKRQGNGQPKTYMGIAISRGSKNHKMGQCRPCQKANTAEGCSRGAECNFCHYPHDEAKMSEVAVFSAKAQLRRLVSDGDVMDTTYASEECDVPLPAFLASPVTSEQSVEEPWYITCEPATTPVVQFQRLSF